MSSSKHFPNVPPPVGGSKPSSVYSRFIPREELASFSAWTPGDISAADAAARASFGGVSKPSAEPQRSPAEELAAHVEAARQAGYHDGYRDGLAALESFKQSFAQQMTAQIGALMDSSAAQLDALQQQIAAAVATAATSLARQVVRSELAVRPQLVAQVAQEALETLLLSARHVTVRVHPDDHPLVAQGAADVLDARGARLVADPSVSRGGCLVESDIGVIDGTIESRWRRAAATVGDESPFATPVDAGEPVEPEAAE